MLIDRIDRASASSCVAEVTDNHFPKLYIKTNDVRKVVSGEDATFEKADRHALFLLTTVGSKLWSNE
jgi:FAD synthase